MIKNNPPWQYELDKEFKIHKVLGDLDCDITVVGGGIAGCSTSYALLKYTDKKVILVEAKTVASGATGHNAGYIVADFERPITELISEFGETLTEQAIDEIEDGWRYLCEICDDIKFPKPEMFNSVGAYKNIREEGKEILEENFVNNKFMIQSVYIRDNYKWLESLNENIKSNVKVLSEEDFDKKLNLYGELGKDYDGIIEEEASIMNSAKFCQEIIGYCLGQYPDRFQVLENTKVEKIHMKSSGVTIVTDKASLKARNIVLCTNSFSGFQIIDDKNLCIESFSDKVYNFVGYMMGTFTQKTLPTKVGYFHHGKEKNGPIYNYFTERKFLYNSKVENLVCLGGLDIVLSEHENYIEEEIDEELFSDLKKFQ